MPSKCSSLVETNSSSIPALFHIQLDTWTLRVEWTSDYVVRTSWSEGAPHKNEAAREGDPIPDWFSRLVDDLDTIAAGGSFPDLRYVPLAPSPSSFSRSVRAVCRVIPIGEVRTYGEIARNAGYPKAAQAVGQCMARNPFPLLVPCHRVVGSTPDSWWNYSGGGRPVKEWLLNREGVLIPEEVQLEDSLHSSQLVLL